MAIDDSDDEIIDFSPGGTTDLSGDMVGTTDQGGDTGETTDQGGDIVALSGDSGGGDTDADVGELDRDAEHENAVEVFNSLLVEAAGDRDEPDAGGDPDPETSAPDEDPEPDPDGDQDPVTSESEEYPEEEEKAEPTPVKVAELQEELRGVDEKHVEVEGTLVEIGEAETEGTTASVEEPEPTTEQAPQMGFVEALGMAGVAAVAAAKGIQHKLSDLRSSKDEGDQGAGKDSDDDDRPRS